MMTNKNSKEAEKTNRRSTRVGRKSQLAKASQTKKFSKIKIALFLIALVYVACVLVDQQRIINEKNSQALQIQQNIKKESRINEELKRTKEMSNSDEYIEQVAREKFGMVKPGEKVFVDTNR